MKTILIPLLFLASTAHAQSWTAQGDGTALLPASQSGASIEGVTLSCTNQNWVLTLPAEITLGAESAVAVALTIDGTVIPTTVEPATNAIAIPEPALAALKAGNQLTLTLPLAGTMVDTTFGLSGSSRAIEDSEANCQTAVVAAEVQTPVETAGITVTLAGDLKANGSAVIEFTGPDGDGDWVGLAPIGSDGTSWVGSAYAYTRNGSPAELSLPSSSGEFELRYISGADNTVLFSEVVTLAPEDLSVLPTLTLAPQTATAGAEITVALPDNAPRRSGDYLYIAPVGSDETDYSGGYKGVPSTGPVVMETPAEAGEWVMRYMISSEGTYVSLGSGALTLN